MEAWSELGIASFFAALLVSLFGGARMAMRSPASPSWLTANLTAYGLAVMITVAAAASLAYLSYALQPFVGVMLGALLAFAIHLALVAVVRIAMPVNEEIRSERHAGSKSATSPVTA